MKALRFYDKGDLRVEQIAEPELVPGSVRAEVACCGICGSDLSSWVKGPSAIPVDRPDPRTGIQAPVTIGHEVVERITDLGTGVEGFEPGDLVIVRGLDNCGECDRCRDGFPRFCRRLWMHGFNTETGGFAEVEVVPAKTIHKVPDGVSAAEAALVEPFCVALHGIRHGGFSIGDSAVVFGAGPIGLLGVEGLRISGASQIVLVEPAPQRREAGLRAGADVVLDPAETDVVEAVAELTAGRGMDFAFEFAGAPAALGAALRCVRPHGTVVNVAAWRAPVEIDPMLLLMAEINLTAVLGYTAADFDFALGLMASGQLRPEWMISRRIGLDEVIGDGFEPLAANGDGSLIKVLVEIDS